MTKKKTTPQPQPQPQPIEPKKTKNLVVRLDEAENDLILFCRALKIDPAGVRDNLMTNFLTSRSPAPTPAPAPVKKKPAKKPAKKKPPVQPAEPAQGGESIQPEA